MAIYRFAPLYVGPKKVGEIEQVELNFMTNGEQLVSVDEVAESNGVVTAEGSFDTVVPVGGMSVDMTGMCLNQTDVDVAIEANGKVYKVPGRIIKAKISSVAKTGVTKGNFSFRGGTPLPIGF